jgi:cytochrome P450
MSTPAEAVFVPRGADSWRDPFPMYRALRDHDPVHHVAADDYWVLSRFEHIFRAAIDAATFSSAEGLTFAYGEMEKLGIEAPIVMMDPPEHTALRRLVSSHFTPQRVAGIAPEIRAFVVERIERLRGMGEADVIDELLGPLPSFVVAWFLGVPQEDRALFDRWTDAIVAANASGEILDAAAAVGELFEYFNGLLERRRKDPGDDMLSALVHARLDGEEVSRIKMLGFAFTMVTGGNDTTTGLLGGALELLTRHPEQKALLREDPARLRNAVEEFLRLTSPVQGLARMTKREVCIEGTTIPAGKKVMLLYASANRDEREYGPGAGDCDVLRRVRRHLSFSYGPHHCIGAAAARLQARIALEELLGRCPDFAVDAERGRYAPGHFVRRYESLPFRWDGAA